MSIKTADDLFFIKKALDCADKALKAGEVPVGAVIVKDNKIIAKGYNKCISLQDTTAHAEIVAIRNACKKLKNYRLNNCTLYVTVEPCAMCAGALVLARIKRVVFGAWDKKAGACGSVFNVADDKRLNHRMEISGGLMEKECSSVIKEFFHKKRLKV